MTSPFGPAVVIVNRRAGRGKAGENLDQLLERPGIEYEVRTTGGPGDATRIAREAVENGTRFLVAVGGDGTISEVVNGMLHATKRPEGPLVLGIIPAGSGSDFIRTFGLPQSPEDAVKHLAGELLFEVDAGKITYTKKDGSTETRYFANIAEAGLGGECVMRAERLPRFLGRVRYLVSFWLTLWLFKPANGKVDMGKRVFEGRITNLVVANGQFFGGGMRIAPRAHPGDGFFDILVQIGTKRDWVAGITKVFKGEHLPSPAIKQYNAESVEITCDPPLRIEADGEVLGSTPATFEIVKAAFHLKN